MLPDMAQFENELRDLMVDEELIKQITKDLFDISHEVQATGFQSYTVDQAAYGDSSIGWSLGYHHSLAHQKVSESLAAVLADLKAFREGFVTFQQKVQEADSGSADSSRKIQQAVEVLDKSSGFRHTHEVNHHYHPGSTDA